MFLSEHRRARVSSRLVLTGKGSRAMWGLLWNGCRCHWDLRLSEGACDRLIVRCVALNILFDPYNMY